MGVVVAKRRGLPWRAIVEEDIVAIVQRDGRGLVASLTAGRFAYRRSLRLPLLVLLQGSLEVCDVGKVIHLFVSQGDKPRLLLLLHYVVA